MFGKPRSTYFDKDRPRPVSHKCRMATKGIRYLALWRKERGLSQEQLGEMVGHSGAYISRLETGKLRYNQTVRENLAKALEVRAVDLIAFAPGEAELPRLLDKLRGPKRDDAIKILKALDG